ncbi:hypothetical protein [Streptomyces sp. NPDC021212]|uniref:hypothetical protein n=1 Tax=Streptomyces sp. NPDC021212 TaxID=3365118 RepID=UPI003798A5E5
MGILLMGHRELPRSAMLVILAIEGINSMGDHGKPPAPNPPPQQPSPRDSDSQHPDVSKPGGGTHRK